MSLKTISDLVFRSPRNLPSNGNDFKAFFIVNLFVKNESQFLFDLLVVKAEILNLSSAA